MIETDSIRPLLGRIQEQHRELHRQVQELNAALQRRDCSQPLNLHRDIYIQRLTQLRQLLIEHFAEEESGGCMEEALSYAPHLAGQATDLEHEHRHLLLELDNIQTHLPTSILTIDCFADCVAEFNCFKQALYAHEAKENHLLQLAFNVDLEITKDS